jgi:hypothetical protein
MKTFVVKHRDGTSRVRANWFRVTLLSSHGIFYRGLRKVALFKNTYFTYEEIEETE